MAINYFHKHFLKIYYFSTLILVFIASHLLFAECPSGCTSENDDNDLPLAKLINAGIAAGYNMEGKNGRYSCSDYYDDLNSFLYSDDINLFQVMQKKRKKEDQQQQNEKEMKLANLANLYYDFKEKLNDLVIKTFHYANNENFCLKPSIQVRINSLYRYQNIKDPIKVCKNTDLYSMFFNPTYVSYSPIQKQKLIEIFGIIWDGEDFQKLPNSKLTPEILSLKEHPFLKEEAITIKASMDKGAKELNFLSLFKDANISEYCARASYTSLDDYIQMCPQNKLKITKLITMQISSKTESIYFNDKQASILNILQLVNDNSEFTCDTPFKKYYYSITHDAGLADKLLSLTNKSNFIFSSISKNQLEKSDILRLTSAIDNFSSKALDQIEPVGIVIQNDLSKYIGGVYHSINNVIKLKKSFSISTAVHEMTHAWDISYKSKNKSINDEWTSLSNYVPVVQIYENEISSNSVLLAKSENFTSTYAKTNLLEDLAEATAYCSKKSRYSIDDLLKTKCDYIRKYILR